MNEHNKTSVSNSQDAISAAIARAKEIAAKMTAGAPLAASSFDGGIHPDRKRQLEQVESESNYPSKTRPGLGSMERRVMDYASNLGGTTTTTTATMMNSSMKTEEMLVPREVVGLVIGRGGDTLKRIQSESRAKIQVDQENRDAPQRRVTIIASSQEDIQKAKSLIEEVIHPIQRGTGRQTVHVNVPGRLVGSIIGRGGESIRELQEKSGAKVQVDPNPEPIRGERIINITGDNQSIDRAKQLIQDILENVGNRDSSQGGKTTITVPAEKIGLVIGRGGETVKQLQQQTGARIIVEKHAQGPEQPIVIIGSPEAVQQAQHLIQELLTNSRSRGGSANYGNAPPSSSYQSNGYSSTTETSASAVPNTGYPPADYYAAYASYYNQYGYAPYSQEQATEKSDTASVPNNDEAATTAAPSIDPYYAYYSYGQPETSAESVPLNYDYRQYALSPDVNKEEAVDGHRSHDHR